MEINVGEIKIMSVVVVRAWAQETGYLRKKKMMEGEKFPVLEFLEENG